MICGSVNANQPWRVTRHGNDPIDILIFGTGDRKRLATATYDPGFPKYLHRLGIDIDYIDLLVNGAVPPEFGGL